MIKLQHKKIGKYLLFTNRKVVQSKYAQIFIGLDTSSKNNILIKVISKIQFQENILLENSLNFELDLIKFIPEKLKIFKYKDIIVTKTNYYLMMDQPKGKTFKKIIINNGRIDEIVLRKYLKAMKQTFDFFHKNNIIHGNINTKTFLINHGNIMINHPSYIKIIEILSSKLLSKPFIIDNRIKLQNYIFYAPELLLTKLVSLKSDIWSLGIVVYQSLFGCLPWNVNQCSNIDQIAMLMNNQKFIMSQDNNISNQMKHFIMKCLQINPQDRYSWQDVLQHKIFNKVNQQNQFNHSGKQLNSEQIQTDSINIC